MLKTEQNTQAMERRIRRAFRDKYGVFIFQTFFEYGQWWVRRHRPGTASGVITYSVADMEGLNAFDFEEMG